MQNRSKKKIGKKRQKYQFGVGLGRDFGMIFRWFLACFSKHAIVWKLAFRLDGSMKIKGSSFKKNTENRQKIVVNWE